MKRVARDPGAPPRFTIDQLLTDLIQHFPTLVRESCEVLSGGIEFCLASLSDAAGRRVVIRFPPTRYVHNENDTDLDFFALLEQEALLNQACALHGIPVPKLLRLYRDSCGVPVLVQEFVETDTEPLNERTLGALVRALHAIPVPSKTVAMRGQAASTVVSALSMQRVTTTRKYVPSLTAVPTTRLLEDILRPIDASSSLLHMDLRPANLLSQNGIVKGVIDWSNALVAHPILELARIKEYGLLSEDFIAGYGRPDLVAKLAEPVGLACRIYTAAMMCVLFLSEIPDKRQAERRVRRLEKLICTLFEMTGRERIS